jgi:hypothetical protein
VTFIPGWDAISLFINPFANLVSVENKLRDIATLQMVRIISKSRTY